MRCVACFEPSQCMADKKHGRQGPACLPGSRSAAKHTCRIKLHLTCPPKQRPCDMFATNGTSQRLPVNCPACKSESGVLA